jgi:hypothetical protein
VAWTGTRVAVDVDAEREGIAPVSRRIGNFHRDEEGIGGR